MFVVLKEQYKGAMSRIVYGQRGDLLKVLSTTVDMLFVESKSGNRFYVRKDNVSGNVEEYAPKDTPIVEKAPPPPPKFVKFEDSVKPPKPTTKKRLPKKSSGQLDLF